METFLAVDIGASGGRHMVGWVERGKLAVKEVYRFENKMINRENRLCWDEAKLFHEILNGMKKCREMGFIPASMSIDTWAVDFALLDVRGKLLGPIVGYRDSRTKGMDEKVYGRVNERELYMRTGIQKQPFNTIYQLMAVKEKTPEILEQAKTFLMVPDYFHYLLTGEKAVEYTNATTTQLVHVKTGEWDWELIEKCGFPKRIFPKIKQPGEPLGELRKEIQQEVGFNTKVVLAATHDTGAAVAATPCQGEPGLYISSGTWSLMGTEISRAVCTEEAQRNNFTNEGGYEHRFRFLKNIMGLWMIQCIRHEEHDVYSFADLCRMAEECDNFPSRVDVNDERFLAPSGMKEEIQVYCSETGQSIPQSTGEIASVIYHSLADSYAETAVEIERILGKKYEHIHIIGGGANADYLSRLTARASGRTVYAGPTEATATGNLIIQMINAGVFKDLEKARECVSNSFPVKEFKPD